MKYVCFVLAAAALVWGIPAGADAPPLAEMDLVERSVPYGPVAMVDGRPIPREQFLQVYKDQIDLLQQASGQAEVPVGIRVRTGLGVLGELLRRELLLHEAEQRGITIPAAEVDQAFQRQMTLLQQQLSEARGGATGEAEVLAAIGKTREEAREELRRSLLVDKAADAVIGTLPNPPDAEVRAFYQENPQFFQRGGQIHLKQIFIRPAAQGREATEEQWEAARQRMEQARRRIHAGESFEAVARDVSDAQDKDRGGDMGMAPMEALPPFYVEVAEQLQAGRISDIFRTDHGLHMVQLVAREGAENMSFEQAAPSIREFLQEELREQAVDDYCQAILQDESRVRIYLQLERTLASLPETQRELAVAP